MQVPAQPLQPNILGKWPEQQPLLRCKCESTQRVQIKHTAVSGGCLPKPIIVNKWVSAGLNSQWVIPKLLLKQRRKPEKAHWHSIKFFNGTEWSWSKRGNSLKLVWCCQKLPRGITTLPSLGWASPGMLQGDSTQPARDSQGGEQGPWSECVCICLRGVFLFFFFIHLKVFVKFLLLLAKFLPLFSLLFFFINCISVFTWRHYEKLSSRHLGWTSSYIIFHQVLVIERIFSDIVMYIKTRRRFTREDNFQIQLRGLISQRGIMRTRDLKM